MTVFVAGYGPAQKDWLGKSKIFINRDKDSCSLEENEHLRLAITEDVVEIEVSTAG